jgi:hypothetical protein
MRRSPVGVANRQTWIVRQVNGDGSMWVRDAATGRKQHGNDTGDDKG